MSRRNSMLIAVVAVVAAIGAYWMLVLSPQREEAVKLDGQITKQQSALATAEADVATYEAAQKNYRANYSMVARLGKAVPADDDVRSLMVQLDSSAKRSHIDFSNIALTDVGSSQGASADPAQASTFVTQPFTFAFKGSFFRLSDFFSHLDRFVQVDGDAIDVTGRLLRIESFTLTPQADGNTLQAQIGATSYSLPETQGLTGGATAQGPAGATATAPGTTPATGSTPPTTTATAGVTG